MSQIEDHIEYGEISTTTVSASSYVDINVVFSKSFSLIPKVICSFYGGSQNTGYMGVQSREISKTEFIIRITNRHTSSLSIAAQWIAII